MKNTLDKNSILSLSSSLKPFMIKHPLFMFFCSQKQRRPDFIDKYFLYYLNKWTVDDELFISESKKTAVSLIDPNSYKFKFSGKHALSLKSDKNSRNILVHQEVVQSIVDIIVPENMKKRVMTIYGSPLDNPDEIIVLAKKCMKQAKDKNFVLVYETLSKKLVPVFEKLGFEISYAHQFIDTQFFQTVMIYNFE